MFKLARVRAGAGLLPGWGRNGSMPQLDTIDTENSNMAGSLPNSLPVDIPNLRIFQINNNSLTGDWAY